MQAVPSDTALWLIFGTSFVVGLSGAVTPGPLLVYDVRAALRLGSLAGPLVAAGHSAVELALVLAVASGAGRFLRDDTARVVTALLGGLVLVWMGWSMFRRPTTQDPTAPREELGALRWSGPLGALAGGATASLSNPFWIVWWASVGLGYIVWSLERGAAGLTAFYTGHILADFAWYGVVAVAVAGGRRLMSAAAYRRLVMACGLALLALGAFFLYSGLSRVVG